MSWFVFYYGLKYTSTGPGVKKKYAKVCMCILLTSIAPNSALGSKIPNRFHHIAAPGCRLLLATWGTFGRSRQPCEAVVSSYHVITHWISKQDIEIQWISMCYDKVYDLHAFQTVRRCN